MKAENILPALVVFLIVVLGAVILFQVAKNERGQSHQDIVCYADNGSILFFAENVRVRRTRKAVSVSWPGGKVREIFTGSCEWGPTDPDYEYDPREIQSWRGAFGGVQWASR